MLRFVRSRWLVAAACSVVGLTLACFHGIPRSISADARAQPDTFAINVKSYGAVGDNAHDDTAAFQKAFNAAIAVQGKLLIPSPRISYKLTGPITIKPATDRQLRLDVEALGAYAAITYSGPSDAPVFITYGLKDSTFSGLKVQLAAKASGVVVWDMRCSEKYSSYSNILFRNCFVGLGTGGRNIAWRSTPGGGFGDFATMHWQNCYVQGPGGKHGDIAWQNGTTNSLPWTFTNCFFASVWRGYLSGNVSTNTTADIKADDTELRVASTTGFPSAGTVRIGGEQIAYTGTTAASFTGCTRGANGSPATAYPGDGYVVDRYQSDIEGGVLKGGMSFYWYGGGGSDNAHDFQFTTAGSHNIFGGRFENGERFLQVGAGSARWAAPINIQGCDIRGYKPPDGILISLRSGAQLNLQSCTIGAMDAPLGAAMITAQTALGAFGSLHVSDSAVEAADPFYTLDGSSWQVSLDRVVREGPQGIAQGYFARPALTTGVQALTYGPTVTPSPNRGGYCTLTVSDSRPFTIKAPTKAVPGTELTLEISNKAGSALGAITWDRAFRLAGAFRNPAAGKARTITFLYNGTHWVERSRAAADL
jgi:hypothetical protein